MNTADPACGEDADAGPCRRDHRRRNGGRAHTAVCKHEGDVAPADLGHPPGSLAQLGDLPMAQSYLEAAVHDGDGGRQGAVPAHGLFHLERRLHIFRKGHSVRDDGRLKRDHGAFALYGDRYIGMDIEKAVEHVVLVVSPKLTDLSLFAKGAGHAPGRRQWDAPASVQDLPSAPLSRYQR